MTQLVLELPIDLYERLRDLAQKQGKPSQDIVRDLLAERLPPIAPLDQREQARAILRAAGLLAELGPEMEERAAQATMTLEEVRAALDAAGGPPLSELILEMRGPKE
ncbi:MAG: hypothetical protein NT075_27985 [Chloroflexi bacterium]|nr:hypothetical protein [Chloroflexota bacterium]